jgi:hypothetical protein
MQSNRTTEMPDKYEYIRMITRYITHARKVGEASDSAYYHNLTFLGAMDQLNALMDMCRHPEYWTAKEISEFVLLNKRSMDNVLPCPANSSREGSELNLSLIMEAAYYFINAKKQIGIHHTSHHSGNNGGSFLNLPF